MALSLCNTTVDSSGRELLEHGSTAFPIACYQDDFRKMDVPWHWHEEWEAVLITEGCCTVAVGSKKIVLHAGEGFFINSGVLHGCWDLEGSGCMFHSIVFHPRLVGGSPDSIFYRSYVQPLLANPSLEFVALSPTVSWQNNILIAIEQGWQHCARETPGFEFRVRAALSELVLLLYSNSPNTFSLTSTKDLRNGARIKAMLSYIHVHYGSEISIADIAACASVSESECLRCFRNTIGTTPIRYLKQYRIQQAVQMLTQTNERIADIAVQCGFQDMSYFSRTFREQKGCVPSEYRKNIRL